MTFDTFQVQAAARLLANGRFGGEGVSASFDAAAALAPGLPRQQETVHGLRMQQAFVAQQAQDHLSATHSGAPRQGR